MTEKRADARRRILQTVNRFMLANARRKVPFVPSRPLSTRHIQRAVFIARQHRLVPSHVLVAAGFNTERAR